MECEVCTEAFDAARRRPKVLPCGHSVCLDCLQGFPERRCPECRQEFTAEASDLPDNFTVLRALASRSTSRGPRRSRFWCSDCKAVAKPICEARHNLRNAQAALQDEVVRLQVQAAQLAEKPPEALGVDDDDAREQALQALGLARLPGTSVEVTLRGQRREALTATWTNPPAAPAGQQGTAEAVEAMATDFLVLALAKKGLWQQLGVKREREGEEEQEDEARCDEARCDEVKDGAEATPDLPVMEELEVQGWSPTVHGKAELLQTVTQHRVRRLTKVYCDSRDPFWSLQLLQLVAPHVEEVQVYYARRLHLQAVLAMPRLRRLHVHGHSADQTAFPAELPPLPAHHVGLRWLSVDELPLETTFGLLRAHAGTLEELLLVVGTPGGGRWPYGYDDLHSALRWCGLARLRRLLLWRPGQGHVEDRCPAQLSTARCALPRVQVQCDECDHVNWNF